MTFRFCGDVAPSCCFAIDTLRFRSADMTERLTDWRQCLRDAPDAVRRVMGAFIESQTGIAPFLRAACCGGRRRSPEPVIFLGSGATDGPDVNLQSDCDQPNPSRRHQ